MSKINIMLIDDHKIFRDGIKSLIADHYEINIIAEASDAEEAELKIFELKPEIILLDISLPKINGIEFLSITKNKFPDIKIIILSMYNNPEYIYKAFKQGAKGYLTKQHTNKEELIEAITLVSRGENYFNKNISETILEQFVFEKDIESKFHSLGIREKEILKLIIEGYTNKEIADKLFVNIRTIETHKTNMLNKLELKNFIEVVKYVIKYNIFE